MELARIDNRELLLSPKLRGSDAHKSVGARKEHRYLVFCFLRGASIAIAKTNSVDLFLFLFFYSPANLFLSFLLYKGRRNLGRCYYTDISHRAQDLRNSNGATRKKIAATPVATPTTTSSTAKSEKIKKSLTKRVS